MHPPAVSLSASLTSSIRPPSSALTARDASRIPPRFRLEPASVRPRSRLNPASIPPRARLEPASFPPRCHGTVTSVRPSHHVPAVTVACHGHGSPRQASRWWRFEVSGSDAGGVQMPRRPERDDTPAGDHGVTQQIQMC